MGKGLRSWLSDTLAATAKRVAPSPTTEQRRDPTKSSLTDPTPALLRALGAATSSGQVVTTERAMRVSAVWACTQLVSNLHAYLPARVYRRTANGPKLEANHPANAVIGLEPNNFQEGVEFHATEMLHVLLGGNAISIIERDSGGRPVALNPIRKAFRIDQRPDKSLVYDIAGEGVFDAANVMHLRGPSMDGILGMSPIAHLREALGVSLAAEEAAGGMFKNGMNSPLILEVARSLSPKEYTDFIEKIESLYSGASKAGRPLLFDGGMKATPSSISAEDMQFLETRRFQIAEIARIYGVPLHMLNETEKSTSWGSGLEQMTQGFVTYSFGHWIRRWEQQRERKLLTRAERASGLYIRKSLQALMRGDSQQRAQFYKEMFAVGAFSANHILELEDMELLPDAVGGIHFRPANFVPLDQRTGEPATTGTTA